MARGCRVPWPYPAAAPDPPRACGHPGGTRPAQPGSPGTSSLGQGLRSCVPSRPPGAHCRLLPHRGSGYKCGEAASGQGTGRGLWGLGREDQRGIQQTPPHSPPGSTTQRSSQLCQVRVREGHGRNNRLHQILLMSVLPWLGRISSEVWNHVNYAVV